VFVEALEQGLELPHTVITRSALLVVTDDDHPRRHPQQEQLLQASLTGLINDDNIEGVALWRDVLQQVWQRYDPGRDGVLGLLHSSASCFAELPSLFAGTRADMLHVLSVAAERPGVGVSHTVEAGAYGFNASQLPSDPLDVILNLIELDAEVAFLVSIAPALYELPRLRPGPSVRKRREPLLPFGPMSGGTQQIKESGVDVAKCSLKLPSS
jgi:hypothetical protein